MNVSDRRVSYKPHDWPNFYVCVMVGSSQSQNSQKGVGKDLLQ